MLKQNIFIVMLFLFTVNSMAQKEQQKEISSEELARMFSTKLAQKVDLSKNQKDSVILVFSRFIDDIKKYRAENNAKVVTYMTTSRDDKIKGILHDDKKYDQYLLFLEDIKKQPQQQQHPPQQQQQGGHHNPMGNGRGL